MDKSDERARDRSYNTRDDSPPSRNRRAASENRCDELTRGTSDDIIIDRIQRSGISA